MKWESKSNSKQFLHHLLSREGREVGEGWERNSEIPELSLKLAASGFRVMDRRNKKIFWIGVKRR
jgi:uncharacterized protein (DUF736 family)